MKYCVLFLFIAATLQGGCALVRFDANTSKNTLAASKTPVVNAPESSVFLLDIKDTDPPSLAKFIVDLNAAPADNADEQQKRAETIEMLRGLAPLHDAELFNYGLSVSSKKHLPMPLTAELVPDTPKIAEIIPAANAPVAKAEEKPIVQAPKVEPPPIQTVSSYEEQPFVAQRAPIVEQGRPILTDTGYSTTREKATFSGAYYSPPQKDADWEDSVLEAIDVLKNKIDNSETSTASDEARLRLLQLSVGNQREAVRPIPNLEKPVQNFWGNNLLGLSALLDDAKMPNAADRQSSASMHVSEALRELRTMCPLRIKNMQFIESWRGFGVFQPVRNEFEAAQTIQVYLEIDNLTIKETALGFHASFSYQYEILDSNGSKIESKDWVPLEMTSKSRINDNCIRLQMELQKMIAPGPYFVRVAIRDMNHPKLQQDVQQIEFRVKSRP